MKQLLTISGSDSLSGGGLQADLRTFYEHGVQGKQLLTCIVTVDAITDDVNVYDTPKETLNVLLEESITPDLSGIKIGMLATLDTAKDVAKALEEITDIPIVLDPVLALKETKNEVPSDITQFFKERLMPLATITTPNLREAEMLSGIFPIDSVARMKLAAENIHKTGVKYVVIKGGERILGEKAIDVLYDGIRFYEFTQEKIDTRSVNGAGCTFASAIAANLVNGMSVVDAVESAKAFVYGAIWHGIPFLPELGNVWQVGYKRMGKEDK